MQPLHPKLFQYITALVVAVCSLCNTLSINAQTYFSHKIDHGQDFLVKMDLDCDCPGCCEMIEIGPTRRWQTRLAISPAREVFGIAFNPVGGLYDLYKIDTLTGNSTHIMPLNGVSFLKGLIAMGGGIFYTMDGPDATDAETLIKIDVGASTITNLGPILPRAIGDMCFFEGEIYYPSKKHEPISFRYIAKLNLEDPMHSVNVAFVPFDYYLVGVSATKICNTLIAQDTLGKDELLFINLKDGVPAISTGTALHWCAETDGLSALVSIQELKPSTICNVLDLDCNDSSLATGSDFNGDTISCLNSVVRIVDTDVQASPDTIIEEIRIRLTGPLPDGDLEYLEVDGVFYSVMIFGDGTSMVRLVNGIPATFPHFNYLLQRMYYHNDAPNPTPGMRTIEFQFVTQSGTESEIATAFIPVVQLPVYPVELGDDVTKCEGETIQVDAFTPDASYLWSTGSTQPSINIINPGIYHVNLYGPGHCPNRDTIEIFQIPVVEVGLGGDDIFCGDEQPELHLDISTFFHLDITISTSTDTTLVFTDIDGSQFIEVDIPIGTEITYTITDIVSNPEACIEISSQEMTISVMPSYEQTFKKEICTGDSILIGFEYESVAGIYDKSFYTEAGCDSNVTIELSVLPLSHTFSATTTCDLSQAGVFSMVLTAANGCDSIHQTSVTYLASDTTHLSVPVCRQTDVGISQSVFPNQDGCDSLVITQAYYTPPVDTTRVTQMSCDPNALGTFLTFSQDAAGCDSVTLTAVVLAPTDTTYSFSSSCIQANLGVFETLMQGHDGCDSLLISTVTFSLSDTTYSTSTSCDPASLGVFEFHFTGSDGCDSTVFNTVTYSATDSVFLSGTSCNVSEVGVFVFQYLNQFGCDSIVTQTISLLPGNATSISSTTCDPDMAGTFIYNLINQDGCDSIVTETISLLPASETILNSTTCRSSEAGTFVETYSGQNGCDSLVILNVLLVPADTTQFFFNTCNPDEVGNIENTFPNQDGCDSLVISTFSLFNLPDVDIVLTSDFNGYGVSCFGETDGSVLANANGVAPLIYNWSTGAIQPSMTGLAAGNYSVTITDANGCVVTDNVIVTEPSQFSISTTVSEPDCFSQQEGSITVSSQGGADGALYSLDGIDFQSSSDFNNLSEGNYNIVAVDANGCTANESVYLNVALQASVELGDNFVVEPGDTAYLNAVINVPFDSLETVVWNGIPDQACPECLSQFIVPLQTATYSISITTFDGCTDYDEITIRIGKHSDIQIPNIFSPNGDGENDILYVTAGKDIEEIASFLIVDRWGNMVYYADYFQPDDPSIGWDGSWRGKPLNSGVFAYKLIATLKNGKSIHLAGNITTIR